MSGITGDWDVALKTPIGSLAVRYEFTAVDGGLSGRAIGKHETTPVERIAVTDTPEGQRVTWRQTVTKPIRLTLEFDVTVHDDELRGHSRAGRLPRSQVSGQRII